MVAGVVLGVIGAVGVGLQAYGMFGPGNSRGVDITQEINNMVESTDKQVVNLITQSVANISHTVIQEQVTSITNNVESQNKIDLTDIVISGGQFSLDQQNNLKSIVTAILNVVQSNEIITNLTNQIKDQIKMSLIQNVDLANQIAATNEVLKARKSSGELNSLIDSTKGMVESLLDGFRSQSDEVSLKNYVNNNIKLDNDIEASINNYVEIKINEQISQSTINNCIKTNNLLNIIDLRKILVEGTESSFATVQENMLVSFYRCIISSLMKTQLLIDLSNNIITDSTTTTEQGAKVSNISDIKESKVDTSSTSSYLDSIGTIVGIIIIIVIIFIGKGFLK